MLQNKHSETRRLTTIGIYGFLALLVLRGLNGSWLGWATSGCRLARLGSSLQVLCRSGAQADVIVAT